MIFPGSSVNRFTTPTDNDNFFSGSLNLKQLEFDPLITGYAFIIWTKVPGWVKDSYPEFVPFTQRNFKGLTGIEDMELQTQSYQYGFNNNDYHVAAGIAKNNTEFTLKHQEYSGSPIRTMYQFWVSGIADPDTGIALYPLIATNQSEKEFAARNHTGELLYIVTRADATNTAGNNTSSSSTVTKNSSNIEFAAYYTNVLPKRIPLAHLEYTQGEHNAVEIEIPCNGTIHLGARVDKFAKDMLSSKVYKFAPEGVFDPSSVKKNVGSNFNSIDTDSLKF